MAFIDKLLEGGSPYGMEIEQPKAHDEINRLVIDNDIKSITQGLVAGLTGGGAGKGLRQLILALQGNVRKAKAIRNFKSGTVEGQQTLKAQDRQHLSEGWQKWEELTKVISKTKNPEMKKYLGRLREELDTKYSGPTGGWYQGKFNLDYDPPSGKEVATLLTSLIAPMLLGTMSQDPRYKGYGKLEGLPNIGLPPKQR